LHSKIDLGEFEAEFKKPFARGSGAQGVLFDEKKTAGRKSRDTVPLNWNKFRGQGESTG
jgi:hypothetical protein